ncbi:hypothetical protein IGI04_014645 [Brassica rapa subsp. trilocularis]|uniref:Uncharacterized protein n=1 Tax=Brassica rapa subsp. trilocularis TaxID=1813537 RepID=A0ABQ7MMS6_BRACM|nr:hypothetical protein IGI04_014645 [Brassica rapa subsp. trilocularis]
MSRVQCLDIDRWYLCTSIDINLHLSRHLLVSIDSTGCASIDWSSSRRPLHGQLGSSNHKSSSLQNSLSLSQSKTVKNSSGHFCNLAWTWASSLLDPKCRVSNVSTSIDGHFRNLAWTWASSLLDPKCRMSNVSTSIDGTCVHRSILIFICRGISWCRSIALDTHRSIVLPLADLNMVSSGEMSFKLQNAPKLKTRQGIFVIWLGLGLQVCWIQNVACPMSRHRSMVKNSSGHFRNLAWTWASSLLDPKCRMSNVSTSIDGTCVHRSILIFICRGISWCRSIALDTHRSIVLPLADLNMVSSGEMSFKLQNAPKLKTRQGIFVIWLGLGLQVCWIQNVACRMSRHRSMVKTSSGHFRNLAWTWASSLLDPKCRMSNVSTSIDGTCVHRSILIFICRGISWCRSIALDAHRSIVLPLVDLNMVSSGEMSFKLQNAPKSWLYSEMHLNLKTYLEE